MGKRIIVAAFAAAAASACSTEHETCFVRGTRVRSPSGPKPIEEIEVGDEVLSFDPQTMSTVVRRVEAVLRSHTERVVTIEIAGRRIVTTDEHPFWDAEERTWRRAADLEPGSVLALFEEGRLVPRVVTRTTSTLSTEEVFNLTVEGPEHTYFAEDVAVHNKSVIGPCLEACTEGRGGIGVRNDSGSALAIEVRPFAPSASIDDRVLTRELALDIPDSVAGATDTTQSFAVAPGEFTAVGGTGVIDIVREGASVEKRVAVVITAGGASNLYIGKGTLITRREDGAIRLVPKDATSLRVVPIRKDVPVCEETVEVPPDDLPQLSDTEVTLRSLVRESGCTSVKLDGRNATQTLQFCGPQDAWPFEEGSVVKLSAPSLLAKDGASGVRLEHADKRAFEIVRLGAKSSAPLPFGARPLGVVEDASCFLPPQATAGKAACGGVRLRAKVRDLADTSVVPSSAPIDIEGGRAWITSTRSTPLTLECAGKPSGRIEVEVVARSTP